MDEATTYEALCRVYMQQRRHTHSLKLWWDEHDAENMTRVQDEPDKQNIM